MLRPVGNIRPVGQSALLTFIIDWLFYKPYPFLFSTYPNPLKRLFHNVGIVLKLLLGLSHLLMLPLLSTKDR